MKKVFKTFLVVILLVFIAIQFFQPALNKHSGQVYTTDFTRIHKMPANMKALFETACYDCHSNNTNYLWFDFVQPARWLIEKHIGNAKKELNFNEWGNYSKRKQERLLNSMAEQIETGQMPLRSYTLLHKNARLSKEEIEILSQWLKVQP